MARQEFYVVLHRGEWKVRHGDKHFGPYNTQKATIRQAVDLAQGMGKAGQDAQVLVQGENHKWRIEWTYGHDPYPPPG
jgi:hypothetical protein